MTENDNRYDAMRGRELHSYRLERRLGGGGMAVVYEASHTILGWRRAVKILNPESVWNDEIRERFKTEAQIMASLKHDNIARCHDFGFSPEGEPFMVVDLLEGEDLSKLIKRQTRLSIAEMMPIVEQVTSALENVHNKGIVHRDLKPENIFLVRTPELKDTVKVLDFGIARVLNAARISKHTIGTPAYMSPEQVNGPADDVDQRSDIFSLAAMTYHCLTGQQPFPGNTWMEIVAKVCMGEPIPPSKLCDEVREPLSQVLMRALSVKREDRHDSATAFFEDFRRAAIPLTQVIPFRSRKPKSEQKKIPIKLVLCCVTGEMVNQQYTVGTERTLLGRIDSKAGILPKVDLTSQELREPVPSVSRQHAEIVLIEDGFFIADLGSYNGTWVNGTALEKGKQAKLKVGDRLRLGLIELVVENVSWSVSG